MSLLLGWPTFVGIFFFEIWWAYYLVGLLSGGLTYGILRYTLIEWTKSIRLKSQKSYSRHIKEHLMAQYGFDDEQASKYLKVTKQYLLTL